MYRFLKIKAFTVLLAWLVIFIHNTIPHYHIDSQPSHCHSLFHNIVISVSHNCNETELTSPHENHSTVCHFSPVFFHPTSGVSHDSGQQAAITASSFNLSLLTGRTEKIQIQSSDKYRNPPGNESHYLRAPPVS